VANSRAALALALALAGVAIVLFVVDGRSLIAGDGHYLYLTARSIAFDGDVDLTNQYAAWGDRWGLGVAASDGWRLPPRELGPAILMVPGLWIGHALDLAESALPRLALVPAAATVGALFMITACAIEDATDLDRVAIDGIALAGALGFVVPFYAIGNAAYPHAPDAVLGALIARSLIRDAPVRVVGFWMAMAVTIRFQNALWLMWPVIEAWRADGARLFRPRWSRALRLAVFASFGVAPTLLLAVLHPGTAGGIGRWDAAFFHVPSPGDVATVLVGVHGLFTWTPIAGLAVLGWMRASGVRAGLSRAALATIAVLLTLLFAGVRDPDAGWAFGARRHAGLTIAVGLGLAHLWSSTHRVASRDLARPALAVGLAAVVAVNLALTGLAIGGWISLAP
jgi:hypothetical protein